MPSSAPVVGRFAPSPTGPLHFGSLLAALASFLDVRSRGGRWLVRIEDLDPPREVPGASAEILRTLEAYGFGWDGEVVYQSHRHGLYQAAIDRLRAAGQAYLCRCSRKQVAARGPVYDGVCRGRQAALTAPDAPPCAVRVVAPAERLGFVDALQGPQEQDLAAECGDFVIRRKDGLYAYQLAVVVDDADQGVTEVLRGSDLLDSTPRQMFLQRLLGLPEPAYAHIPVIVNEDGQKLSKQTYAPPLEPGAAAPELLRALRVLGQAPPAALEGAPARELLAWGVDHWERTRVPGGATVPPGAGLDPGRGARGG